MFVGLAPCRRDVVDEAVERHRGRAESLVGARHATQQLDDRGHVALDHEVEIGRLLAEQQVAHRAADQVDVRGLAEMGQQRPGGG